MKQLITLCLAVFFMAGVQNVQAQSKEETIAWLKEKLNNSTRFKRSTGSNNAVWSNFAIKKIDECSIVITYKYAENSGTADGDYEQTLPTKDVNINEKGQLSYSSNVVVDKNTSKGKNLFTDSSEFEIVETEPDLRNRVLKALKHLATFCVEKKQAF